MSDILIKLLRPLEWINARLTGLGSLLGALALALMVLVILTQVFCRYALNNALPWPEEAARFLMLWMTGLAAPAVYRRGGFVAIDMLEAALPRRAAAALALALLVISALVLAMALQFGWKHVNSGWLFNAASLWVPLDLLGMAAIRVKLAWMYMSIFLGFALLMAVNAELILRSLIQLGGGGDRLTTIPSTVMAEAE
ncbi:TRAP transporter small permease [Paracoccus sp. S1E-3]|uniref:TRAP transporter small permease n=1 Tax=Paracoccus sp. S1E-3 TaxID=2756130 RepID=UPI0015EEB450|nr:TRAP transporter small permease subunit [Paracoccus sp. S1E-3]MBA4489432.1 TRAP transporter small permease subunit [Paracoccus sp. S1E-3]